MPGGRLVPQTQRREARTAARYTQARGIRAHKEAPNTVEATERSGNTWGQHGLSETQVEDRQLREHARNNYYWASGLNNQLKASKGKWVYGPYSKDKRKRKGRVAPKTGQEMSKSERHWLYLFWEGTL